MGNRDRRRFIRIPKQLEMEYTSDATFAAQIADLGEGGAFLATPNLLPAGTGLQYKFYLPDDPKPIEGEARVAREEPTVGMAVEFQGLPQEDHERIKMFVASVLFGFSGGS